MLRLEYPYHNNDNLIRHWSDEGYMILQVETGYEYAEAVDIYPCRYTYQETDHLIPTISEEEMEG